MRDLEAEKSLIEICFIFEQIRSLCDKFLWKF